MEWKIEIVRTLGEVALGVIVGVVVMKKRGARREQLLQCYAEYCANVIDVLFKNEGAAARAALLQVSYAAHRLELLEPHPEFVVATGMLFAKCNELVSAIAEGGGRSPDVARLRAEISTTYWDVVDLVREKMGERGLRASTGRLIQDTTR